MHCGGPNRTVLSCSYARNALNNFESYFKKRAKKNIINRTPDVSEYLASKYLNLFPEYSLSHYALNPTCRPRQSLPKRKRNFGFREWLQPQQYCFHTSYAAFLLRSRSRSPCLWEISTRVDFKFDITSTYIEQHEWYGYEKY